TPPTGSVWKVVAGLRRQITSDQFSRCGIFNSCCEEEGPLRFVDVRCCQVVTDFFGPDFYCIAFYDTYVLPNSRENYISGRSTPKEPHIGEAILAQNFQNAPPRLRQGLAEMLQRYK